MPSSLGEKVQAAASKVLHPKSGTSSKAPAIVTEGLASVDISGPKDGQRTPADEAIHFFESTAEDGKPVQVWELQLDGYGAPGKDKAYIRLPPPYVPYVLRVSIEAGSPASKKGVFKTNFPLDGGVFDRDRIQERALPTDLSKPIKIDLPISHAGAFLYWVEYDVRTETGETKRVIGGEGYFNIDPVLQVKKRSNILSSSTSSPLSVKDGGASLTNELANVPLDGLVILSVVSKWMGSLDEWKPHLKEAMLRGYNMLHFTPLQQRGESLSPYSIADQLAYDSELFGTEWKGSREEGTKLIQDKLKVCKDEYGLMSLTDVVLNHTANNCSWLVDHPEAGFSVHNSPHLAPALELDTAMLEFSASLSAKGLPTQVTSADDLDKLMDAFGIIFDSLRLWEYYVLNVEAEKEAVRSALASSSTSIPPYSGEPVQGRSVVEIAVIVRAAGKVDGAATYSKRFGVHVDPVYAASVVKAAFVDLGNDPSVLAEAWGRIADVLNVDLYEEANGDKKAALDGIRNRVKYTRLDAHGPKMGEINARLPLVETYFTRLPENAQTAKFEKTQLALANNGWIWDANPLQNFAELPSKAYLRREVIVWGDCVKLRYGESPESNPWLWSYMTTYVKELASIFDGFRIDNCHSTPLHVGMKLLDAARETNPNLYVCAELFTGNEETDLHFVSRLGLNSLIREAMNGHDPKEFSRLLYRHGVGKPIGSMDTATLTSEEDLPPPTGKGPIRRCLVTPLQGSVPHALMYDITHDNESPLDKRSAEDALSTAALVTFSYSAIGSNKGFDDLYPKLLDLVNESRKYEVPDSDEQTKGISHVKRVLNHLHTEMVLEGYSEGHVHQENEYIVLHRIQPSTQKGYVVIAHTAFSNTKGSKDRNWITPIKFRRQKLQYMMGYSISIPSYELSKDPTTLRGLPCELIPVGEDSVTVADDESGPYSEVDVPKEFPPGSMMVFRTEMTGLDPGLDVLCATGADEAFSALDLVDLNVVLHRADGEEKDATDGKIGVYDVPNLGTMKYCGLEGWMHPLRHITKHNDLGHPLCSHLRDGTWALDYITDRLTRQLEEFPRLAEPVKWFQKRFELIKTSVPNFLRPKYFAIIIITAYKAARRAVVEQCSDFISSGHSFTQNLALTSVQMYGQVKSASITPDPSVRKASLAAGLPHFTAGWARCWGRDVFISLRGLFLTTGNFAAAKEHIIAFSSTLKHGLIPNLLDSLRAPRYNSRDSPWWMLQNIQDYVQFAPEGLSILEEVVPRRFPKDETWIPWNDKLAYSYTSTVAEIIQEILQKHAEGISFREHNAGPNLDSQMRDEGFNIDVKVDWETGLILGGSAFNCGTWMDKMGESEKAKTKGQPGTPRDGAPVEIIGLLKSTLRWLDELSRKGTFPFKGVEATIGGKKRLVTYGEWQELLQASFEKHFYVPIDPAEDSKYVLDSKIVNRRGIYKDVYGSGPGREWSDYQFRCNFPIAMTVAPELFDPHHALSALQLADRVLRAPLGMKTLDPADSQYRGNYDNSNDSDDPAIAKGRNYHQGPEWGWPLGFFLRAYLYFDLMVGAGQEDPNETLHYLHGLLLRSREYIATEPWAGLPELTNINGTYCSDSCETQAWSNSTLLDFLQDVYDLQRSA
ncbi:glycoside hydrolase family 13 protein [Clavulina sp. PMI_390]|nr:glycoside hydrolase family 13 protein [Clavulina sp. PMI_390]